MSDKPDEPKTATAVIAGVEVAKLLLQGYFSYARQQGLSDEEADALYDDAKADFAKNTPDLLEDV